MQNSKTIARTLSALAHPSRVDILKCLLTYFPAGLNAGRLSSLSGLAPSTLSHHLREMEAGNVITRSVKGRSTVVTLNVKILTNIANTLMTLCCSAQSGTTTTPGEPK